MASDDCPKIPIVFFAWSVQFVLLQQQLNENGFVVADQIIIVHNIISKKKKICNKHTEEKNHPFNRSDPVFAVKQWSPSRRRRSVFSRNSNGEGEVEEKNGRRPKKIHTIRLIR